MGWNFSKECEGHFVHFWANTYSLEGVDNRCLLPLYRWMLAEASLLAG